ncbi:ribosomal protein L7Ae/L30e/S12e/Gadd45 family protein [Actinidia rufa]|uniref:Ribosomal protein L7Ae/L30e/S12e/Gadd45 family protein n=1 Tax=Actinidia rufa TaxID=165716 RepID=A0A7J0GGT6_9ERIC|nr:ribosomal protein L7Ae/L30e/S12e/Gadd45 family protein [Actinidia rufa]
MAAGKKTKKTHESINKQARSCGEERKIHPRLQNCAQDSQELQREAGNYFKQLPAFEEIGDRVLCYAFEGRGSSL